MTPWIIVNFHTPWYNTYTGKHNEMEAIGMKKAMEDLFYKYHVNAAFSGHVHAYERFLPMYKNVTTVNATIYMTVGTGGQSYGKTELKCISSRSYVLMSPVYFTCLYRRQQVRGSGSCREPRIIQLCQHEKRYHVRLWNVHY